MTAGCAGCAGVDGCKTIGTDEAAGAAAGVGMGDSAAIGGVDW